MIEILLVGEVGNPTDGMTASEFARQLRAANGEAVTIRIASPGGDLFQGLSMYDYLRSLPDTTAIIDGVAASIAAIVALGARKVVMPRNASIMIHAPSGEKFGGAEEFRLAADLLDAANLKLANIIAAETGASLDQAKTWLAGETWFSAEEALAAGFVDEISDAALILNHMNLDRFAKVPEAVRDTFNQARRKIESMKVLIAGLVKAGLVDCSCMSVQAPDELAIANEVAASVEELAAQNASYKEKIAVLEAQIAELTAKQKDSVKARATTAIEAAIGEGRIAASIKDTMILAYVADEAGTIANLAAIKVSGSGAGTRPLPRSASGDDAKTIKERVEAEPDPRKRMEMRRQHWDALSVSPS